MLFSIVFTPVQAETLNCTPVTSLPAVINTQGIHCLIGNLATNITNGPAILITANNVTLDLNGWKVGGQAAGTSTNASGVVSLANNVTIRNGIVRGFRFGVQLSGRGAVVEDMLVDQCTEVGISVGNQGAIVRHNQIVDTGGSTAAASVPVTAILAGPGSLVQGNLVAGLAATGVGLEEGIRLAGSDSLAIGNFVTDSAKPAQGSIGINVLNTAANVNILRNTVSKMTACIAYQGATGIFVANTVTGCDTNFDGGTAGQQGNNF